MHTDAIFAQSFESAYRTGESARPRRYLRVLPTRTRPSLFGGD